MTRSAADAWSGSVAPEALQIIVYKYFSDDQRNRHGSWHKTCSKEIRSSVKPDSNEP
jgi:hypothetical protein